MRTITCGTTRGVPSASGCARARQLLERAIDQLADLRMLDIPGRRDDQVRRGIGFPEVLAQHLRRERFDRLFGTEDRARQRMPFPEVLGEELVNEIVRRILDHLDLFEDDLLLALDLFVGKCRIA